VRHIFAAPPPKSNEFNNALLSFNDRLDLLTEATKFHSNVEVVLNKRKTAEQIDDEYTKLHAAIEDLIDVFGERINIGRGADIQSPTPDTRYVLKATDTEIIINQKKDEANLEKTNIDDLLSQLKQLKKPGTRSRDDDLTTRVNGIQNRYTELIEKFDGAIDAILAEQRGVKEAEAITALTKIKTTIETAAQEYCKIYNGDGGCTGNNAEFEYTHSIDEGSTKLELRELMRTINKKSLEAKAIMGKIYPWTSWTFHGKRNEENKDINKLYNDISGSVRELTRKISTRKSKRKLFMKRITTAQKREMDITKTWEAISTLVGTNSTNEKAIQEYVKEFETSGTNGAEDWEDLLRKIKGSDGTTETGAVDNGAMAKSLDQIINMANDIKNNVDIITKKSEHLDKMKEERENDANDKVLAAADIGALSDDIGAFNSTATATTAAAAATTAVSSEAHEL
jgi:hypothetical protein